MKFTRQLIISLFLITLFSIPAMAEDVIQLGLGKGTAGLYKPKQMKEGPDGNIYIYDIDDAYIKVYSSEGNYLHHLGGKGDKPGKIKDEYDVCFGFIPGKKELFFTAGEGGALELVFVELDGKLLHTIKTGTRTDVSIAKAIYLKDEGFLLHLLSGDIQIKRGSNYTLIGNNERIVKIDKTGSIQQEIFKRKWPCCISSRNGTFSLKYIPIFTWDILNDNAIVFSDGLQESLYLYNHDGSRVGSIEPGLPRPIPVTPQNIAEWKTDFCLRLESDEHISFFDQEGKILPGYKQFIYEKIPNNKSLSVTPKGNILILMPKSRELESNEYWLVNRKGEMLFQNRVRAYDLVIDNHYIFFKTRDHGDNLRFYAMKRVKENNEADSLKSLLDLFKKRDRALRSL